MTRPGASEYYIEYEKKISVLQKLWNYIKQKRTTLKTWLDYINEINN